LMLVCSVLAIWALPETCARARRNSGCYSRPQLRVAQACPDAAPAPGGSGQARLQAQRGGRRAALRCSGGRAGRAADRAGRARRRARCCCACRRARAGRPGRAARTMVLMVVLKGLFCFCVMRFRSTCGSPQPVSRADSDPPLDRQSSGRPRMCWAGMGGRAAGGALQAPRDGATHGGAPAMGSKLCSHRSIPYTSPEPRLEVGLDERVPEDVRRQRLEEHVLEAAEAAHAAVQHLRKGLGLRTER